MLDKIKALDDATFFKLKAVMQQDEQRRRHRLFAVGKMATFESSKHGETIRMMITGRGPKNVMGYRIHNDGRHDLRAKWRVNPSLLTPYNEPVKTVPKFVATAADRPTYGEAIF